MKIYPKPLEDLISHLSKLPGIGQKSASRVALYILRSRKELAESLSASLLEVKEKIRFCPVCFNFTDKEPCDICSDSNRANGVLCVVEGPGDQIAIEETGIFNGRYHVLHGVLAPLDGVGPEDLKIGAFMARLETESIKEVILATNPTAQGEATAHFIADLLVDKGIKVTRIAMGVPMGGDLKYMDSMTLRHSFKSRVQVEK
jgi:recombination protein RecR